MLNQTEKANCERINIPNPGSFFGLVHEHMADALDNPIVSAKVQEPEHDTPQTSGEAQIWCQRHIWPNKSNFEVKCQLPAIPKLFEDLSAQWPQSVHY